MNRYYQKFTAFHQSLISLLSIVATFCLKEMALVQRGSFTAGKPAKCALPLLVVLFILPIASFAATRYSVNTGNWNSTSTWSATNGGNSGASIPTAADTVYIYNGSSVTIPSGYAAACSQLHFAARNTSSPKLIFSASTSSLTITNDLVNLSPSGGCKRDLNVNAGTLTIGGDLLLNQGATGTSNKWETNMVITSGKVNLAGDLNIGNASGADYRQCEIYMSGGAGTFNLGGNMILGNGIGTLYGGTTSTFNYNGASSQTVQLSYSRIVYNNLHINSANATLGAAITTSNVKGNLRVQSGTLDNAGFAIAGNSKILEVVNGALLKLGATTGMPTGFTTKTLGTSSTIHYYGNNQTVTAETFGNLILSGTSGTVVKTFPGSAFTIAGNLTSQKGTATTVSFTASNSIKIGGNLNIGASTTFNASSFAHAINGDLDVNGTLTGSTSTITMGGSAKIISGSGSYNFNNLTITGSGIEASANTITIAGNLATTGAGTFTQTSGSTIMSGTTKTVSGSSINLLDLTVSGTITSTSELEVSGNLAISSTKSLIMSAGSLTMSGANKTITNSGTLTLSNLTVTGNVTTASGFTISSLFDVADGTFTASAGTVTFTGTSTLEGTANLFNVTLNGTSLQLYTDAILGIAGTFTKTAGSLNVTTTTPNTVHYNGSISQNIPASNYHHLIFSGGTTTATGIITVNGNFTINAATTFAASTFTHVVNGSFINNGTFTAGTSTMQFSGATDASITGATTFNNITINKSTASASVNLQSNVSVATINMTLGTVKTFTSTLTITTTRTGAGIILGNILRSHAFSTGVTYEFEGQYNTVTFTAATGVTSVLVKVTSGTVGDFPNGSSINRLYDISVPSGTYIATLRLHYEDAELNGNAEANLNLYKYTTTWNNVSKTTNNTVNNYVDLSAQTNISNRWTLSDAVDKIVSWNGSVSSAWATAGNWTAVSGSPAMPPTANEIVQIGTSSYTNAPVISTAVTVKSISFGSAVASTLSLTGGSLTVTGNIAGSWSADRVHTINANNQNITVNGSINLSEGVSGRAINLNIGTGTVTVGGSVTQSGGANIVFSGAGNLSVGGDYNYTNGTFTASTGTVTYTGATSVNIAAVNYNNLTITKNTNPATLGTTATINGNLAVTTGQLILNAPLNIIGNVTLSSGTTLTGNANAISVGGNWSNTGTFTSSSTVTFNGSGAQSIGTSTFNNITINKAAGAATLTGNLTIAGNMTVTGIGLDMSTFTANRSAAGGVFTLGSGATLSLGGASNFPGNFNTNTINNASTVTYNGTVAQSVSAKTYGNLVFSNGAANAKTASGSFTVNGNVTINSGATFAGSTFTISLLNNWTNSGTFTPGTSTLNFNGIAKTITGVSTFNNATINGRYTVANTNLTTTGQLWVNTGGTFNAGTGLLTVSGNLINNGSFISPGTVTITGTSAQTIQYSYALQTTFNVLNFNGNTAPTMTSTSSPTIATLVINNTAGITTSVDWTVTTSATINASCAFNGGVGVHRFQGSFINNGTITSSGEIFFTPSTAQTIQLRGTNFTSSGTVTFGGTAALTVSGTPTTITNVVIDNSVGVSSTVGWSIAGDFTINPDKVFNASTFSYSVAGDFQGDGVMNPGTSTFTLSGTGKEMYSNDDISFYDLVISGTRAATSDYNVLRNFTNNGTYDGAGGMAIFTGDLSSTISGTAASFAMAQVGVQKSSAGLTVTLAKNITGVIELDVLSGTFVQSTFTVTQDAVDGGNLWVADNATYKIAGTNSLPVFLTYNLEPASTIEYAGAAQSVSAATTYGHVIISTSGNKTAAAALSFAGNFSLAAGTFIGGNFTHNIAGNWTMTSGAFTNTNTKITLNGTADQTISSTGAFNNFEINKATGDAVLATDITVNGILNFVSGKITTSTNKVILPAAGSVSGAAQVTGWVNGYLQKNVATGSNVSRTFEVGGSVYYSPMTSLFASVSVAGNLVIKSSDDDHPQLASSTFSPSLSVNRYYTATNSGITFTTATLTFNWNAADLDAGAATSTFGVGKYSSSTWTYASVSNPTATSIQAISVTTFGDFAIANYGYNISGNVFEDVNYGGGAGRTKAASSGVNRSSVRLELFSNSGAFVTSKTTDGSGNFSFTGLASATYYVRAVTDSVSSSRTGYVTSLKPVLTYRTNAASGTAVAVTDFVGGLDPATADATRALSGWTLNTSTGVFTGGGSGKASAFTQATISAASITGVDFGFNFNTITNKNNTGQGSLRQAITNMNTLTGDASLAQSGLVAAKDNAVFMISNGTTTSGLRSANNYFSGGITTIALVTELPIVTSVIILDAQKQPGWTLVPLIELNGSGIVGNASGISLTGGSSTVRGFVINRFSQYGILLSTAGSNTIQGNYLGTTASGNSAAGNVTGILLTLGSGSNTIGGNTSSGRNVISGNGHGIAFNNSDNNIIQGNYIGLGANGTTVVGNTSHGIDLYWGVSNTIGGTGANEGNIITGSGGNGVLVTFHNFNRIAGNNIYGNTGLNIDLGYNGVTVNNGTKNSGLPNYDMDYPVFTSVTISGTTLTVAGYVGTAPSQSTFANARVEIFKSDNHSSGYGGGQIYYGFLTADASGNFSGSITVSALSAGDKISATATDATYNTSEFGVNYLVSLPCVPGTWIGVTSTAWSTASNWNCGTIPTSSTNVTIPAGKTYYPVITTAVTGITNNITINAGGSVTINAGAIDIYGTITNNGTFNATLGSVALKGSSAQTIPANLFVTNIVNDLIINNTAGVSLNGSLIIANLLSVQNGAFNTNNYLTLRSNSETTARVGAISSASPNPITGNVTVERYVAGRRKYRLITSPVTTSTNAVLTGADTARSIWGNWQNGGVATSGVGTIITGGTTANGFDQGTTSASLYTYDAENRKYVAYTSANGKNTKQTPLTAGVGYYMFVYGDRINSITSSTPNPTTLKQTGTLLTGTQTYNPSSAIPISGTVGNYSLIGNPYACTIDWKSVTKTNVSKTIWGWDANLSSTGGYVTVTATVLGALVSPSSNVVAVNRYVQPGQAFFVLTTAANPQVLITEADKIDDKAQINSAVFRGSGVNEQPLMAINLLYKLGSTTTLLDGALVAYDGSFDNEVNYDDGLKMTGAAEVLAIQEGTSLLSISARKYPAANDTLTINLAKITKSQYTLEIFAKELESSGLQPWLYDAFLNQMQALSLTDTNYINFTVKTSDPATYSANRFKIVFKNHVTLPVTFTNITAVRKNNDAELQWNVATETNLLAYELQRSTDGMNFKTIASVLPKGNNNTAQTYVQMDNNTTGGNNYYRVKSVDADGKQTLSNVVMVKMDNANPIVKVFPNPVREGKIFIQLSNFTKGKYMVILFNGSGQKIMAHEISHAGGAGNYEIDVDKRIAKGMYYLRVQNETESFNQTIVFE